MSIGERIREFRKKAKLTQAGLGEICGMKDSAIRRYESGKGNPTEKTLRRIADALGVPLEALITEETVVMPGLITKYTETPDSDYDSFQIDADSPEKLAFMLNHLNDAGLFQHLLLNEFQKLNVAGQTVAVQLVQQLAQKPEFQQSGGKEVSKDGLDTEEDNEGRS